MTAVQSVRLTRREEHRDYTCRLIEGCRRRLDIISPELEPALYDTAAVSEALRALALRSAHSRVRILVPRPQAAVSRGHRLLELSRRLSSFISLRAPAEEDTSLCEALLLADEAGVLSRPVAWRLEGLASFDDRPRVNALRRRFDGLWERARGVPDFNRLHL